ncbi:hypothetical protein GE061_004994 [Apolygus lucorum]|uniref:Origin recognition complex subunit 3 n=1 Tax=Apolygus lucorum TaxID=248454 RepID=A0A6A4J1D0_APOLU|nr:hypothetical protein GE061_004994 [Apolygus lucorum]
MDSTVSVSRGCFAFPATVKGKKAKANSPLNFDSEGWYRGFKDVWDNNIKQLDNVEGGVIETLMQDLTSYISSSTENDTQIPAAAILTGINLPDHGSLFSRLKSRLHNEGIASGVAILRSTDCITVKNTVERCISHLMESPLDSEDEFDEEEERQIDLKRSQCTLPNLSKWVENLNSRSPSPSKKKKTNLQRSNQKKLVVILRDFETFNPNTLSAFIQILSGYQPKLPFILVFGIATTLSAIDEVLPHSSISRLSLKAFQAQPSVYFLNNTLNKVFLTPDCPFQLSGKLFKFFTQVFLFYDFSVNRFIQGVKYCVMEHYRVGGTPTSLLCCPEALLKGRVDQLAHDDIEHIRRLGSFRSYVESTKDKQKQIKLLSDDTFTKKEILKLMTELRLRIKEFYLALSLLHHIVAQLPQYPLGKQLRELYAVAMSKDIWVTAEYKECKQLLGFLSKDELVEKTKSMIDILVESGDSSLMKDEEKQLKNLLIAVEDAGVSKVTRSPMKSPMKNLTPVKSRSELRQKVVELGIGKKSKTAYELAREDLLNYVMDEMVPAKLRSFTQAPLWEIVTLVESEARYRVVPRIRAPIHTALNNPAHYLMCECCKIVDDDEILPSMPDLCIAYKLHLESGSLINMYDWLQSFNVLVSGKQAEDEEDIDLKIQARFTQAVSEMEFLGFVKSSKKKADHVARLTWGGSTT